MQENTKEKKKGAAMKDLGGKKGKGSVGGRGGNRAVVLFARIKKMKLGGMRPQREREAAKEREGSLTCLKNNYRRKRFQLVKFWQQGSSVSEGGRRVREGGEEDREALEGGNG